MSVYIPPLQQANALKINAALHRLAQGGSNATGSFTLNANATSTTVTIAVCSALSVIDWQPTTADAAAQMATLYCTSPSSGQFVLTHASNTSTDQTFNFHLHS